MSALKREVRLTLGGRALWEHTETQETLAYTSDGTSAEEWHGHGDFKRYFKSQLRDPILK